MQRQILDIDGGLLHHSFIKYPNRHNSVITNTSCVLLADSSKFPSSTNSNAEFQRRRREVYTSLSLSDSCCYEYCIWQTQTLWLINHGARGARATGFAPRGASRFADYLKELKKNKSKGKKDGEKNENLKRTKNKQEKSREKAKMLKQVYQMITS